ncbi:dodecin domain-containing protein [Legionella israelensis]|nr:dodecin family protein [Legionella israelensis]QBR85245.1 dodecin domain-containing protein [Legionella israelensis]QBS09851.1 dodecin domain-containing protein [Legionella israelensis]QDP71350.1 dodecin domain-containing protein [Legionella israelensis]
MKNTGDYTGYSETGIEEAIQNALEKAGEPARFEVIETLGAQDQMDRRHYQVTLKTFTE